LKFNFDNLAAGGVECIDAHVVGAVNDAPNEVFQRGCKHGDS
jgi:hypothetical protein